MLRSENPAVVSLSLFRLLVDIIVVVKLPLVRAAPEV